MGFRARVLMWGLFVGAAAAALAPAGPGALVPLKMAIASADSVGNDVYVAVVVDFGSGSSQSTVSKCVPVTSSALDSDALAAAVGSSNVAYGSSGLVCAIDNYPVNGVQNCGQSVGSGDYDYWSYWHGATGSWVYADDGPAEHSVSSAADDVEGWRFQTDEPAGPSDPPPAVAPSYAQICNASTEVPPAQSPSAPTTTTTIDTAPPLSVTPTTVRTSAGSAPATTTTPAAARPRAGVTTTTSGATTTTLAPASPGGAGGSAHGSTGSHRSAVAGAVAHEDAGGGGPSGLLPVILVAVVVAVLGGIAFFRWRRKPAEE